METAMDRERSNGLRYMAEMGSAALLYVGVVFARKHLLHDVEGDVPRMLVMASPVIPIWLMFWTILRHYQRIDEYMRLQLLQIVALCAGIAAAIYCSYPFVADAFRLPPLDISWAWPIMALCWLVATFLAQFRNRRTLSCTTS